MSPISGIGKGKSGGIRERKRSQTIENFFPVLSSSFGFWPQEGLISELGFYFVFGVLIKLTSNISWILVSFGFLHIN